MENKERFVIKVGRPKLAKKTVRYTVVLDIQTKSQLQEIAGEMEITPSELVRQILTSFCEQKK